MGRWADDWFTFQQKALGAISHTMRLIESSNAQLTAWRAADPGAGGSVGWIDRAKELALAEDHVRRGEALVARQHEVVARLNKKGLDAAVAVALLEKLEASLDGMRAHLEMVRREVKADEERRRGGTGQR